MSAKHQVLMNEHNNGYMAQGPYNVSTSRASDADAKPDKPDPEEGHEDSSALKKPRVVWSAELHQQFVTAVNTLGIDKAVPKRILDLMGVQGLTRENVASHLQKYRLYLKRLQGVNNGAGDLCSACCRRCRNRFTCPRRTATLPVPRNLSWNIRTTPVGHREAGMM